MSATEATISKGKQASKKQNKTNEEIPSCFVETNGIMTTTVNDLPGFRVVKNLGAIFGITVRSRNWGADIGAFLRSSVGGELTFYTNLMYTSRNEAMERLVGECMKRGGNPIIAMRFDQGEIAAFSQVCAYGTAVIVEQIE